MKESIEFKGIWYLPGQPEKSAAGNLYYKKGNSIKLELIGSLSEESHPFAGFFSKGTSEQKLIYGESSTGKKITLVDCFKGAGSYNTSCSFPLTSFDCTYIIIGKHLANPDEQCFNKITVLTPALSDWPDSLLIREEIDFEGNKIMSFKINIDTQTVIHTEVDLGSKLKLSLATSATMTGQQIYPDCVKINQLTYFHIETISEKLSFFELLKQAGLFIQFLSLATYSDQYPIEVKLQDYDDYSEYKVGKVFTEIELFKTNRNEDTKSSKSDFLFSYRDIEDDFSSVIQKWFSLSKDLMPIRNHLLNSIKRKPVFTSLDFLIVVQALEGYHTRFINKKRISLQSRIEDLITLYSSDVPKIAKLVMDVQVVVNTRDYYSHFFETDKKVFIKESIELFRLTEKLRLLLICCILDLIGFNKQKINEIVNKHNLFDVEN
ncbi:MAG: hypothetical protein Q8S54_05325 [Bacteroidota bacterium]|nr:hypothetical protein [Odoribacter sp.]MDP3642597.1 hypothetical protein [Bacteroidota bacterium]